MRIAYAHDAVVTMPAAANAANANAAAAADAAAIGAPGAAITVALCGHWRHEPPCPLAPHHTAATRAGDQLRLRILFATEPDRQSEVRRRTDEALANGRIDAPDGGTAGWRLITSEPSAVLPAESDHAGRLTRS